MNLPSRWSLQVVFTACLLAGTLSIAQAATITVAVAANFAAPMKILADGFQKDTGHQLLLAFGATGQFYAQIRNGAPLDVLLAADDETPIRIEAEGFGVAGSRQTYAIGRLVLWSSDPRRVDPNGQVLRTTQINRIAVANPKLSPYGAATREVIERLKLTETLQPKLVEGANVGQAYQFVSSGNADMGFVALSQVSENGTIKRGSGWIVSPTLHSPIRQDAILLKTAQDNPAAAALLRYLQSDQAKAVIRSFGYEL